MLSVTISQVMAWRPCYSRESILKLFAGRVSVTALDGLAQDNVTVADRIWFALHVELIDERTLRLFAVWCARQALALSDNPDPRSVAACDVAERYANGLATGEELAAAGDAAWDAAWAAARDAAWDAARAAAWDAMLAHLRLMLAEEENQAA